MCLAAVGMDGGHRGPAGSLVGEGLAPGRRDPILRDLCVAAGPCVAQTDVAVAPEHIDDAPVDGLLQDAPGYRKPRPLLARRRRGMDLIGLPASQGRQPAVPHTRVRGVGDTVLSVG